VKILKNERKTMKGFAFLILWVAVSLQTLPEAGSQVCAKEAGAYADRPNIILILADDLAPGDLGAGDGNLARTPNLDRLADQSVRFSQAYSASCVCAPARAALLTGRYPQRAGVVTLNMNRFPRLTRLRRDESTIANVMQEAGYTTGLIGKWHVGRGKGYHPLQRGFSEFEGFDGSQSLSYFDYLLDVNRTIKRVDSDYLTANLSNRAIEFVRRHREHPFFLHLAHYAPHRPLEAPAETIRHYRDLGCDQSTATIYAMIEVMDRGIGELLEELDELKLADNTIVLFASDNGPDPLTGQRFNRNLRGTKYQVYEGGIRVPLFVRWPGELQPGDRTQLVHFVDLVPTLLDLCGIDETPINPFDGESFAMVLRDAAARFSPTRYWHWNRGVPNYTHNAAIRQGPLKLVRPYITRSIELEDSTLPPMLYDLASDPTESKDIANERPDVVERMNSQLQQWADAVEKDRVRPTATKEKQ
jgi:arylsulfatase A-like enzyme